MNFLLFFEDIYGDAIGKQMKKADIIELLEISENNYNTIIENL
jgi:hypothetical protein